MTTIVVRDGIIAADSFSTVSGGAGGDRRHLCTKIYRVRAKPAKRRAHDAIIAAAGEVAPALLFVDWYKHQGKLPEMATSKSGDFTALVLSSDGLLEYDGYYIPMQIGDYDKYGFYAIGSGAKAALGALHMGATAYEAVRIAARIDPYTGGDIVEMSL